MTIGIEAGQALDHVLQLNRTARNLSGWTAPRKGRASWSPIRRTHNPPTRQSAGTGSTSATSSGTVVSPCSSLGSPVRSWLSFRSKKTAAAIMGSVHPDLYAAVGVHSGLACGDMASAMGRAGPTQAPGRNVVPTIVSHGDKDRPVAPINGDLVIAQSRSGARCRSACVTACLPAALPANRIRRRR